jgi:hypothetical protein
MITSAAPAPLPEPCEVLLSDDASRLIHELSAAGPLCPAVVAARHGVSEVEVRVLLDELATHGLVRPLETGAYERVAERIVEVMALAQRSILGA